MTSISAWGPASPSVLRKDAVQVLARVLFFGTRPSFKAQLVGRGGRLSEILATRMFVPVLAAAPPHVGKKQLPWHFILLYHMLL